jgi:hypothetical protein
MTLCRSLIVERRLNINNIVFIVMHKHLVINLLLLTEYKF